jgi:hypothetical protein
MDPQIEATAAEMKDLLRISHALLTMRIGLKAIDAIDWRRRYGARFRAALREIQGKIASGEGRRNRLVDELVQIAERDEWQAVKEAERIIEVHLIR